MEVEIDPGKHKGRFRASKEILDEFLGKNIVGAIGT